MSENRAPGPQVGTDPGAEIDLSDPAVAWNFGTRELTADEFAEFARRDLERVEAAREAGEFYAAWKAANPEEATRAEAEFRAADRAAHPVLYGEMAADPEPEAEID